MKKNFKKIITIMLIIVSFFVFNARVNAETEQKINVICNYSLISSGIVPRTLETYPTSSLCGVDNANNSVCSIRANVSNFQHQFRVTRNTRETSYDNDDEMFVTWFSIYRKWQIDYSYRKPGKKMNFIIPYLEEGDNEEWVYENGESTTYDKWNANFNVLVADKGEPIENYECNNYFECPLVSSTYGTGTSVIAHSSGFGMQANNTKCPRFMVIRGTSDGFRDYWWNYFFSEYAEEYDQFGDDLHVIINGKEFGTQDESLSLKTDRYPDSYALGTYYLTDDVDEFKKFIKDNKLSDYNNYSSTSWNILPLTSFKAAAGTLSETVIDQNKNTLFSNLEVYSDIMIDAWGDKLDNLLGSLKNSCSSSSKKWDDYINVKNYSSYNKTNSIYDYFKSDYPADPANLEYADKEISNTCWDSRKELVKVFDESFLQFLNNIGFHNEEEGVAIDDFDSKTGLGNIYSSIPKLIKSNKDNNIAERYTTFEWIYLALTKGITKHLDEYESVDKDVSKLNGLYKEAEEFQKIKNIYDNDQCAYKCSTEVLTSTSQYDVCVEHNTEYQKCKKQVNDNIQDCYNKKCKSCELVGSSSAKDECFEKCEEPKLKCVEEEGSDFSYEEHKKKKNQITKKYNDTVKKIDNIIDTNHEKYGFVASDPLNIIWTIAEYEPKCSDVIFLHYIWNVITIGAPFLVIILGSIDYFKNVISTDQNARSKNKKNFIRRLVALILLILVPFLIKIIVNNLAPKDSKANNIKLMQCIVNGD